MLLLTTGRAGGIVNTWEAAVNDLSSLSSPNISCTTVVSSVSDTHHCIHHQKINATELLRSPSATNCCRRDGFFTSLQICD
ncbi:hypothetical protein PBY51_005005 [Eleginops maclovinus]|uniref:Uncharacterized protein n=1 Tax=Eleginops maclovinus TaxID=56733 RepID=A0AAN7X5V8_ELEMC|nr:hypothetical protein PBY51_005005 [Eleginops maclovinus]